MLEYCKSIRSSVGTAQYLSKCPIGQVMFPQILRVRDIALVQQAQGA